MNMILPAIIIVAWVGIIAFSGAEGLWSNIVLLFLVLMAALIAANTFEPAAAFLSEKIPLGRYLWDLVASWGIFGLSLLVMRLATDRISKVKVRFLPPVENSAKWVVAALVGWVVVSFGMTTMHTAPLIRNYCFGGFNPDRKMLFGLAPDRQWLGFVNTLSKGSLTRGVNEENQYLHEFDADHQFLSRYADRRTAYSQDETMFGK